MPGDDRSYMDLALAAAERAARHDDVPVGCCIVVDGEVVAVGENRRELDRDPTSHAEVVALRAAAAALGRWRLSDATVYVTLEPCAMCAGALVNARVARVVIAAADEKAGAVGSRYNLLSDPRLLHEASLTFDVGADASRELLQAFFASRRGTPLGDEEPPQ